MKKKGSRLPADETAQFCGQVALLLRSGILLTDAMETLCAVYADSKYAPSFVRLRDLVCRTGRLSAALEETGVFPPYLVRMADIGERAGTLETVLADLSAYYAWEASLRGGIRRAVAYPLALLGMLAALVAALAVYVMPLFANVFSDLGADLPAGARRMMVFGRGVGGGAVGLTAALGVLAVLAAALWHTRLRFRMMYFFTRLLPFARRIQANLSASRFSGVMQMLLKGGFPLSEALGQALTVMEDASLSQKMASCQAEMEKGASFPETAKRLEIYSSLQLQMLRVGDISGSLDRVLGQLREDCAREAAEEIQRVLGLIEPLLVVTLALIMGGMLLSVMLPLGSVLSAFG